jgi:class 3 adenylate cyclase
MAMRKQYNRERITDVEINKTDDLLSKLVPIHVLKGLKNDERVVEQLENVTLLYTDMVGFTAFSNSVEKPQEVVHLLSTLFSKFDQLVEAKGVYKVHTIGDCYVVMGFTGKINKYRRNENI